MTVTKAAIFLMPDGCNLWPPYRCGWNFFEIWRWLSFFQRLDVIALAILLAYVVIAAIYVSRRIRSANAIASRNNGQALSLDRVAPGADLHVWVGTLKSIARVAPFFGLAGVCDGIFGSFRGSFYRYGIAAAISGTVITTAAGLIVAIPATCVYHHLRSRIGRLEPRARRARNDGFQVAQTLPLAKPFSHLPAFPLIAVPCLGISALAFITLHSAFFFSKGLWVGLSPVSEPEPAGSSLSSHAGQLVIVLCTVKDDPVPDVYLNSKKVTWDELETSLRNELSTRSQRVVYIRAQNEVRWAYLAEAVDAVKGLGAKVVLQATLPVLKPTQ